MDVDCTYCKTSSLRMRSVSSVANKISYRHHNEIIKSGFYITNTSHSDPVPVGCWQQGVIQRFLARFMSNSPRSPPILVPAFVACDGFVMKGYTNVSIS